MSKIALLCLAATLALSGCAGLDVEWQASATYQTDELRAKRARIAEDVAEAQRQAAIGRGQVQ